MPPVPPNPPDPDDYHTRLLTIPDAAAILGVHRTTLYRRIYQTSDRMPAVLIGGRLHVPRAWVDQQIARQDDTPTNPGGR